MKLWENIVDWFERRATQVIPPPEPAAPEYDRPPVSRTSPEEQRKAEEAVKTLDAYVRAQTGRRPDSPRR